MAQPASQTPGSKEEFWLFGYGSESRVILFEKSSSDTDTRVVGVLFGNHHRILVGPYDFLLELEVDDS